MTRSNIIRTYIPRFVRMQLPLLPLLLLLLSLALLDRSTALMCMTSKTLPKRRERDPPAAVASWSQSISMSFCLSRDPGFLSFFSSSIAFASFVRSLARKASSPPIACANRSSPFLLFFFRFFLAAALCSLKDGFKTGSLALAFCLIETRTEIHTHTDEVNEGRKKIAIAIFGCS